MFSKLKQFNDLKNRAKAMQDTLAKETAVGSAAWGKVKVTMNGNIQATQVEIDDALMNDKAKLQEHLRDAINDATGAVQKIMASKLKDIGGLDLANEFGDALKT